MQLRIDRKRVKALMDKRGIESYRELALQAELHYNTISMALAGDNWNSKTAEKIAKALDCSPIDLQVADGFPEAFSVAPVGR